MEIRDETRAKYIRLLTDIAYKTDSFNVLEILKANKIDVKIFGFLKSKDLLTATKDKEKFIVNFKVG